MHIANKKDFISAIALLALMALCFVESFSIDARGAVAGFGPLFFPYLLMGAVSLLALALLVSSVSLRQACTHASTEQKQEPFRLNASQAGFLCLFFFYLLLLPYVGYLTGTALYLAMNMIFLGKKTRSWRACYVFAAIGITAVVYYVFAKLLLLFLP